MRRQDEEPYDDMLRTRVLRRDNFKCRRCGEEDIDLLTIHHIIYRSQGGEDMEDNLVTVCWRCHRRIHDAEVKVALIEGQFFFGDVEGWRFRRIVPH